MRLKFPIASIVLSFVLLAGCGGGASGGPVPTAATASRLAVGPDHDYMLLVTGFGPSGEPLYATSESTDWSVWSSGDAPLYQVHIEGATNSFPDHLAGRFVVGEYDDASRAHHLAVAERSPSGVISVRDYPGLGFSVAEGDKVLAFDWTASGNDIPFFMLDLGKGTKTPVTIPAGAAPYAMRGRYVTCAVDVPGGSPVSRKVRLSKSARSRSLTSAMSLLDLNSGRLVPLQAPSDSDGNVYAYVLNSRGQVIGVTSQGDRRDLHIWGSDGVPGPTLDSSTQAGDLTEGWISDDGRKYAYSKRTEAGDPQAYMQVGGQLNLLSDVSFPLAYVYGLDPKGTVGFGYDTNLGRPVTVRIAYR